MFLSGVAIRTLSLFFFLLRQPLSDVWWLPTNRHRLPTNRHRLHTNRYQLPTNRHRLHTNRHRLPTNRHRLPTNRHRLPTNRHRLHTNRHRLHTNRHRLHTNRHRLPTNRHQLPTGRHHRAYWTLRVFFFLLWQPLVSMGAIQQGTSWATIPKTLNRARTVHAPCAHRARTVRQRPQGVVSATFGTTELGGSFFWLSMKMQFFLSWGWL